MSSKFAVLNLDKTPERTPEVHAITSPGIRHEELSKTTWPDFEKLFSQKNGWDHCQCMHFHRPCSLPKDQWLHSRAERALRNRREKRQLVEKDARTESSSTRTVSPSAGVSTVRGKSFLASTKAATTRPSRPVAPLSSLENHLPRSR